MSQKRADDKPVEEKLRKILEPFDRHLDRFASVQAWALVGIVPATFLFLWLLMDVSGKRSLGWAVVAFGVLVVFGLAWDSLITRLNLDTDLVDHSRERKVTS